LFSIVVLTPVTAEAMGFSVSPIFPENQNPDISTFFDASVTPGERQRLAVMVENTSDDDITVDMSLFTVGTNRNGVVDYTVPGLLDESMIHSFSDIAFLPMETTINIPAGQSATVPVYADIPAEGFDGLMLGAIRVLLGITDEQRAEAGMIVNRFARVIIVRMQENDTPIAADFLLGNVGAEMVDYRAAIVAQMRNPMPRLSLGADIDARIYPAGETTPIWEMLEISADFAPNSIYELTFLDHEGFGIHPGDYRAVIRLDHEGRTWNFEREFTIETTQAAVINSAALNQQQMPAGAFANENTLPPWAIPAIIILVLSLVILVATLIVKANKKNQEMQRKLEQLQAKNDSDEQ
jgi:hypothetical protein